MRAHHLLLLIAIGAAGACGTEAATTPSDDLSPAPPAGGQQLATSSYLLDPGGEIYMCYQFYAPDERVAITRIQSIQGDGVHHVGFYQAYGRDESPEPHECPVLIKQTWTPIWGSNTAAAELVMPTGTGFVIEPGTQYIVQLHLQNTGDTPLDIRVGLNLTYEHDVASITPAGIFALGAMAFEIPPTTTDHTLAIDCPLEKPMTVFAVEPHMHKLGTKMVANLTPQGGTRAPFYMIDPWAFGEQPIDPLAATLAPGDRLDLACHYDNPTSASVGYGESSDKEMCFFVLYYYPFDHLDGCITSL
ncbi:MAG: hypothetical protein H0T79_05770 [Deltaproteobacteria bacterium]|nr:hypothetical protein [Deltaproteobacteria bacterium]